MPSPEALENQKAKDLRVLEVLEDLGSNLAKPHRLRHRLLADSHAGAEGLADWGRVNGFEPAEIEESESDDGKVRYSVELVKPTPPDIEHIFADSTRMLDLADERGCEYDGWACPLEK